MNWHCFKSKIGRMSVVNLDRVSRAVVCFGLLICGSQTVVAQERSVETSETDAVLKRYCVGCHNERLQTGGLALDILDASNPAEAPEVWERVIAKLRAGSMPPPGS